MKQLLFGQNGQVAQALQALLGPEITVLSRRDCDFLMRGAVRAAILREKPDVILNASAYTLVDRAESEPQQAWQINAHALLEMGTTAEELQIPVIHYSTDYVFDGLGYEGHRENDPTHPLNVYGQSKLAGEKALLQACRQAIILRTSWVFSPTGPSFVQTMLRLAREKPDLQIVADQIGSPTSALQIARVTKKILSRMEGNAGIYHLSSAGSCSWYEFAQEIFRLSQDSLPQVPVLHPVPTSEYKTPAKRPLNSRLNTQKLRDTFGVELNSWQENLRECLDQV